ncbi:hypothetical protein FRB97_009022 [Tulasnella sp. 331]|nr:hypothetical protein FRB97_009022 [Tulasnella sp. 331]
MSSFPSYNTPAQLSEVTAVKLIQLKVDDQEQRKLVLAAIRKAGYMKPKEAKVKANATSKDAESGNDESDQESDEGVGPSVPTKGQRSSPARKRKRAADEDGDSRLSREKDEGLEFGEELDEQNLRNKSTHVNRAPVMTAWATIVAERLGFKREEALSIASVYTELNATSKGISIGVFDESKNRDHIAGSTQPFVEVMGRKPVLETESGEWRGIVKGSPVDPNSPYGYIHRSFRQTLPWVIGSMRLLANSFEDAAELNRRGYDLYCDFRPENPGWGKKAEMRMESILKLRPGRAHMSLEGGEEDEGASLDKEARIDQNDASGDVESEDGNTRPVKRSKVEAISLSKEGLGT